MSKIEAELLKATGIKGPKNKETVQAYFDRLIKTVQELEDTEWEKISEPAQKWVNVGAKAVNAEKDIPNFPDAKKAKDEDEEEEKPARKSKAKDDDEEEKKPARKAKAKDDDEEEKPARWSKSKAKDEDDGDEADGEAEEGDDAEDGEDDGEEEVAKTSKKANGKKNGNGKKDTKPARTSEKAEAAAPKKNGKPARKGAGAQELIKRAVIKDPKASTESIAAALAKKGVEVTPSAVSTIRSGTLQTLRLVKEIGMPKGDI